jgi:hypothetical protein
MGVDNYFRVGLACFFFSTSDHISITAAYQRACMNRNASIDDRARVVCYRPFRTSGPWRGIDLVGLASAATPPSESAIAEVRAAWLERKAVIEEAWARA